LSTGGPDLLHGAVGEVCGARGVAVLGRVVLVDVLDERRGALLRSDLHLLQHRLEILHHRRRRARLAHALILLQALLGPAMQQSTGQRVSPRHSTENSSAVSIRTGK